jgi:hypothetical protein
VLPALQRGQSHTLLWLACEASQGVHGPIRLPIALIVKTLCVLIAGQMTSGKLVGNHLASRADQSKHPDEPLRFKEI